MTNGKKAKRKIQKNKFKGSNTPKARGLANFELGIFEHDHRAAATGHCLEKYETNGLSNIVCQRRGSSHQSVNTKRISPWSKS